MACRLLLVVAVLIGPAGFGSAQDLPTTQLEDYAQTVRQRVLTRSLLRQHGASARGQGLNPRARATCLYKRRAVANLGAGDPRVRRLYALCAQAGY